MASGGQGPISRPLQIRSPATQTVLHHAVSRQQHVGTVQPVRRPLAQGAPVQAPTRLGVGASGVRTSTREMLSAQPTSPIPTTIPVNTKPMEHRVLSVRRQSHDVSARVQEQANHEARFNELRVYIDEQVKSVKASPPETPSNLVTPSMVEDFDERLEGALTTAALEQTQKIEEMRVALENRIDSAIQEMRLSQSEQIRVFRDELDSKLAQVELHASQAGASAAAQAIADHQPIDHRALANEASGMEMEFAAFRQQHDNHVARVQGYHNDHSALIERVDRDNMMIRQNYDSHVSNVRDVEARCTQLELALQSQPQTYGQAPELPPNVATKEDVEARCAQLELALQSQPQTYGQAPELPPNVATKEDVEARCAQLELALQSQLQTYGQAPELPPNVATKEDVEARCAQLEFALQSQPQTYGQAPELPPNVATKEWVEMCVEQVGRRVEHTEKLAEHAEHTTRDLKIHVGEWTRKMHQLSEAHAKHPIATQEQLAEAHGKVEHATQQVQTWQQQAAGPCNKVNMDMVAMDLNVGKRPAENENACFELPASGQKVDELKRKSTSVMDRLVKLAETEHGPRRKISEGSFESVGDVAAIRGVMEKSESLSLRLDALLSHVTPAVAEVSGDSQSLEGLQGKAQNLSTRLETLEKAGCMNERLAILEQANRGGLALRVDDYAKASFDSRHAKLQGLAGKAQSVTSRLEAFGKDLPENEKANNSKWVGSNFSVLSEKAATLSSRLATLEKALQ